MYRIVAHNPDGSSYTIYDPAGTGALPVLAPRTTEELNEAGSLEFALIVGHSAYGNLLPKASYFSVELDGEEFFYGRLLTPEESPLLGQIQYTCSGALSLLQDSELPADGKKEDGTMDSQTMTAEAFLRRCIENHNADIGNDPRRTFTVGIVNHPDKDKEREYQISSYVDTLSAIKQNIIEWYGGFLRVRSDGNGGHLIDWVSQYGDTDAGTLDLGENILSLTHRINTEDLVTAIRPVGKDGLLLTVPTIDLFPAADMQKYGKIVKSVTFSDCDTEEALQAKADEFVARIHNTYRISSDIKLVDMHFVDGQDHGVNLGDMFTNIYGMEGTSLIVGTRSRDFENPQNDSISLKSPREYEGDTSGGSYSSRTGSDSLSSRSSKNSAGAGYAYKYIHEFQDRLELNTKEIAINAETLELHGDRIVETANNYTRLSHKADTLEDKVGIIEGTGVIQNSEHITSIAGKFQLNTETNEVELINGTEFVVHERNGATITVGNRLSSVTSEVNSLGQRISTIEGSALWTQRDNITGVVGEFDVVTAQDGTKTLRIRSGGGIKVLRDNAEFGLYDEGTLTAGVIVREINRGTTKIAGNKVVISGDTTIADCFTVDGYGIHALRKFWGTDAEFSNPPTVPGINFSGYGGTPYNMPASTVATMIKEASRTGNTLTLTRFDGTVYTLDFNRATTLTGAWDSGTYTVTASPQGSTRETTLQLITPVPNSTISRSNKNVSRQFKVQYGPNESSLNDTGFVQTITIDASSVYDYGWGDSYAEIGLNYSSDQELSYNTPSVTIYPTGKATPSASAASIISKGITVRVPYADSNWTATTINRNAPDGFTKVTSGGQVYYTNDNTSGASKGVRIYIAPKVTVDGHEFNSDYTHQVYFSALPTRIWADAYSAGQTAGSNAGSAGVTLNDPTWNALSGATIPSSRTVTVSTSGRKNSSGTTDNLEKTVTVTVSVDSSKAYIKHSGTTVAEVAHSYKYTQAQYDTALETVPSGYEAISSVTIAPSSDVSLYPGGSQTVAAKKNGTTIQDVTVNARAIKKITLDAAGNHVGSWYNYIVYFTDDTSMAGYTNGSSVGLYLGSTTPSGDGGQTLTWTVDGFTASSSDPGNPWVRIGSVNKNYEWVRFKVTVNGEVHYYKIHILQS